MINIPGIVLLDVKGLLMHAYYRGNDRDGRLDQDGNLVNTAGYGLRGFIETYLQPTLRDFAPSHVVAVWDAGNDYRTSLFADYKSKRKARDKVEAVEVELEKLYKMAKVLLAYCGAANVQVKGTEADDVIAAFVERLPVPTIVHTVDRDLLQLASDKCLVMVKGAPCTDFEGYPLSLVRIYKSLVGDSTDGYGGVPQVGPKAFDYLYQEYGEDGLLELEQCVAKNDFTMLNEAINQTGDKVLEKLSLNRGVWRTMYLLASLHPWLIHRTNSKEVLRPEWYVRMADREKVEQTLNDAGAEFMMEIFEPWLPTFTLVTPENVEAILADYRRELPSTPFASFDWEGYDALGHDWSPALPDTSKGYVDVLSQTLTGGSFSYGANFQKTFYLPVAHSRTANLPKDRLVECLLAVEEAGVDFVAHNARFEEQVAKQDLGFLIEGPVDTMILSSYVDENEHQGLKDQSALWFRYDQENYSDLLAKHGARDMRDLSGEEVLSYGCDDSLVAARLAMVYWMVLHLEGQWDFAYNKDRYTCHVFNRSFETGVNVDYEQMERLAKADQETIDANMALIRHLLEEHCQHRNECGSMELRKQDGENLIRLEIAKGLNRAQAEAKIKEKMIRWADASVYRPFKETFQPEEFMATAKGFSKVAGMVGIEQPLDKLTPGALTDWLIAIKDVLRAESADPRAVELVRLLTECGMAEFKKREGEKFLALKQFVEGKILHECGKRILEGDELNMNSPVQMQELFYCKLQLPVRLRTKVQKDSGRDKQGLDGSPSTNEEAVMAALAEDCPEGDWRRDFLKKMLEVKECTTRFSLYYKKYPYWKHPRDGVIHPSTKNCGTATRRPAGKEPNLLAVSKGPLRSIFIPRFKKHVIVSLDFSGQELRLTGSESNDPVFIEAYTGLGTYLDEDGMLRSRYKDIHSLTGTSFASRVLEMQIGRKILDDLVFDSTGSMDYDLFLRLLDRGDSMYERFEVLGDALHQTIVKIRKMAKVVNFLIIYGGQAFSMSMKLGVPQTFAQTIIDGVYKRFPRLEPWQNETVELARKQGYVTTAFGTRKHVPSDILSRDGSLRSRAERQTVNHVIQGGAADILKVVMTGAYETRLYEETKASLIAPVYDEITNSVLIDNVFEFVQRAQDIMNITPPGHAIPMLAEVSIGRHWAEAADNELGDRPSQRKIEALFDKWAAKGWEA